MHEGRNEGAQEDQGDVDEAAASLAPELHGVPVEDDSVLLEPAGADALQVVAALRGVPHAEDPVRGLAGGGDDGVRLAVATAVIHGLGQHQPGGADDEVHELLPPRAVLALRDPHHQLLHQRPAGGGAQQLRQDLPQLFEAQRAVLVLVQLVPLVIDHGYDDPPVVARIPPAVTRPVAVVFLRAGFRRARPLVGDYLLLLLLLVVHPLVGE
mmetsp:Transcript_102880/g.320566  ORF Transcript_102880/g.320566 Transcript_102880/m.320566 type:complete len:211 (+) Transcript_102880:981-1613(+)